jgi:hypothetical protein
MSARVPGRFSPGEEFLSKSRGFTRARLRRADQIASLQGRRNGRGLDGCCFFIPGGAEPALNLGVKLKTFEIHFLFPFILLAEDNLN